MCIRDSNLIGGIVLGFIWQFVFNNALTSFGSGIGSDLLSSSWLSDPTMAFWALVVVTVWQYSGYMMTVSYTHLDVYKRQSPSPASPFKRT